MRGGFHDEFLEFYMFGGVLLESNILIKFQCKVGCLIFQDN